MRTRRTAALLACCLLLGTSAQARLVQEQISVPVQVQTADGKPLMQPVQVILYRESTRPHAQPVAVLSHGRPADPKEWPRMGQVRFAEAARYFVEQGYLVAVPTRIGYGVTGGPDVESSGNCQHRHFEPGFTAAATQILSVMDAVQKQPQASRDKALLVGHSYGAVASLAAAAMAPQRVAAVINFSGGAGADATSRPDQPCSTTELAALLQQHGRTSRVPGLWLYAANDHAMGQAAPRQWLQAYRRDGGVAEFHSVHQVGTEGHTLFTHFPVVWKPLVTKYLRLQRLPAAAIAH